MGTTRYTVGLDPNTNKNRELLPQNFQNNGEIRILSHILECDKGRKDHLEPLWTNCLQKLLNWICMKILSAEIWQRKEASL
jgi:hypothetical protein